MKSSISASYSFKWKSEGIVKRVFTNLAIILLLIVYYVLCVPDWVFTKSAMLLSWTEDQIITALEFLGAKSDYK